MRITQVAVMAVAIGLVAHDANAQSNPASWRPSPSYEYSDAEEATSRSNGAELADVNGHDHALNCTCGNCCTPLWTVNVGTAVLHRSTPRPEDVIQKIYSVSQGWVTALDASEFHFNWDAGLDVSAIRRLDRCQYIDAVDFRYLGVPDSEAETALHVNTQWRTPLSAGGLPAATIETSYTSQLNSAEFNVRRESAWCWLTWTAGFRWIALDEEMDLNYRLGHSTRVSTYKYTTDNDLYGGQIGAVAVLLDDCGPWRIESTVKAGLYGNVSNNRFHVFDSFGQHALVASDDGNAAAFAGDIGLVASYQLTNHIALQGGYQLLWLQGVAVAGDQPSTASPVTHVGLQNDGSVFYHGALASVVLTW